MSDLYEGICNVNDGLELIVPTSFEEALSYAQQILWLYYNKQDKLVEGENITLTDNPDGTVTISCTAVDNPGIKSIVGTVGPTGTQVVVTLTDDTTQSFFVERGPKGDPGVQGQQGPAGADGADGTDGVSPTVSVTSITGGHQVSITDAQGTETFNVMDGTDGTNGTDGTDGVSPTVSVTSITGGHQVSITDAQGTDTFNVMDGADGATGAQGPAGPGVPTGGTAGQFLKKNSSTDYDTGWGDVSEVPTGGSNGDVLTQSANGPIWQTPSAGGGSSFVISGYRSGYIYFGGQDLALSNIFSSVPSDWSKVQGMLTINFRNKTMYIDNEQFMSMVSDTITQWYNIQMPLIPISAPNFNFKYYSPCIAIRNGGNTKHYLVQFLMTIEYNNNNTEVNVGIPNYMLYDIDNNTYIRPTTIYSQIGMEARYTLG